VRDHALRLEDPAARNARGMTVPKSSLLCPNPPPVGTPARQGARR
jgi:hypothetical protein